MGNSNMATPTANTIGGLTAKISKAIDNTTMMIRRNDGLLVHLRGGTPFQAPPAAEQSGKALIENQHALLDNLLLRLNTLDKANAEIHKLVGFTPDITAAVLSAALILSGSVRSSDIASQTITDPSAAERFRNDEARAKVPGYQPPIALQLGHFGLTEKGVQFLYDHEILAPGQPMLTRDVRAAMNYIVDNREQFTPEMLVEIDTGIDRNSLENDLAAELRHEGDKPA